MALNFDSDADLLHINIPITLLRMLFDAFATFVSQSGHRCICGTAACEYEIKSIKLRSNNAIMGKKTTA